MKFLKRLRKSRSIKNIVSGKIKATRCLKGLAAAEYYPKAELRALGDVDFLIDPEKKEELAALFVEKGYSQHLENHACHIVFKKPAVHLEMHFEPSGIPYGEAGERARRFFEGAAYKGVAAEHGGDKFTVPQPMLHGMILALHMQHHQVSEGLGLRHLCDWACFVDRTADEDFWSDLVAEFKKIGLQNKVAETFIKKVVSLEDKYIEMCRDSYLTEDMKEKPCQLIYERIDRIS